jgi:hypothetical protein
LIGCPIIFCVPTGVIQDRLERISLIWQSEIGILEDSLIACGTPPPDQQTADHTNDLLYGYVELPCSGIMAFKMFGTCVANRACGNIGFNPAFFDFFGIGVNILRPGIRKDFSVVAKWGMVQDKVSVFVVFLFAISLIVKEYKMSQQQTEAFL